MPALIGCYSERRRRNLRSSPVGEGAEIGVLSVAFIAHKWIHDSEEAVSASEK